MASTYFLLFCITISSYAFATSCAQRNKYHVPLPQQSKDWNESFPDASKVWEFMISNGVSRKTVEKKGATSLKTEKKPAETSRAAIQFSDKRGIVATLSQDRHTATRESEDTINALVYTIRPLLDDEMFEIRIVSKDDTSNPNAMMFGVTAKNLEEYVEIPDSMTRIMAPSWFLLLTGLFENNGTDVNAINNAYCPHIAKEGDRLGVLKKWNGDLHFYYNGNDLGVAKSGIRDMLYPVVDIASSCKTIQIN
ncbi:neuralized-like protein 4 isoform X2 [Ischnura elegans]|uniref:neuralized-like protein 4 isoform X2 n=1 Tax=Ischnura elegans TaxID=197161 RepID=UPI001ED8AF02|nr:neuralized-like protein 4 isoform X2 [Ischnura elegans]